MLQRNSHASQAELNAERGLTRRAVQVALVEPPDLLYGLGYRV